MNNKNLILSDRYELIRPLGQGECGSVFLVRQQSLEQYRAMKRFPKNTSAQPLFAISEAQILKSVQHPGIPTIYDFEEDESFYYLVEEYIQGDSLEEFLLHQQSISQNQFLYFCEQLCDIFAYLHTLRPSPILYQDLKPEHIIVCGTQLKLIDFSVASFAAISGKDFNHFGNVDFSAPELISGKPVTLRSDIYSIGKIMEYMMPYLDAATNRSIYPKIQKAISADAGPEFYLYLTSSPFAHFDSSVEQELRKLAGEQGCELVRVSIESEGMLEFLTCSLINSSKMKGIFVTASVATEKLSEILNSVSVPVVIIGNSIPGVACDRVSTANEEGAYKATMHLIRSGHENIAILCGSEDREFNHERIEGYKRALRDNQIPIQDQYIGIFDPAGIRADGAG